MNDDRRFTAQALRLALECSTPILPTDEPMESDPVEDASDIDRFDDDGAPHDVADED